MEFSCAGAYIFMFQGMRSWQLTHDVVDVEVFNGSTSARSNVTTLAIMHIKIGIRCRVKVALKVLFREKSYTKLLRKILEKMTCARRCCLKCMYLLHTLLAASLWIAFVLTHTTFSYTHFWITLLCSSFEKKTAYRVERGVSIDFVYGFWKEWVRGARMRQFWRENPYTKFIEGKFRTVYY